MGDGTGSANADLRCARVGNDCRIFPGGDKPPSGTKFARDTPPRWATAPACRVRHHQQNTANRLKTVASTAC